MNEKKFRGFIYHRFSWVHVSTGLFGNFLFFIGSIMFFWESTKNAGVWLFVIGSLFMWLGSMGNAYVQKVNREKHEQSSTPQAGNS